MSTLQLPDPLALYLEAEATGDTDVLERCFHVGAVVHDEAQRCVAWRPSSPGNVTRKPSTGTASNP